MMNDLISRQAAIDAFDGTKVDEIDCTEYDIGYNDGIDFAVSKLSVLPSAQPEKCEDCGNFNKTRLVIPQPEIRKGKWIGGELGYCTCCGHEGCASDMWDRCDHPYCSNCGAEMEVCTVTAKEYLRQIRRIDVHIDHLLKERDELERAQTFLRSPQIDGDRVQTSPSGDPPWIGYIIKWEELTNQIGKEWDMLIEKRQTIVAQINTLTDARYSNLLYKRYVENKRWGRIAREMNYSVDRILHLHGEALGVFQQILAQEGVV